jgi:hypothetical protein
MLSRKFPPESGALLALAASLVPRRNRQEWRDSWCSKAESWWIFNRDFPGARLDLFRLAAGAVPDALWRRLDREEAPRRLHLAIGHPLFLTGVLIAILGVIGWFSDGYCETRATLWAERSVDPRLVILSNHSPLLGYAQGVPSTRFLAWARYQKSLERYAAYSWGTTPDGVAFAKVEAAFFQILGVKAAAGRLVGGDCFDCAVSSDRSDLGRTIKLDGQTYRIAGVLPPGFRFASARPRYWIFLNLGTLPRKLGVIGLLRPGVSMERAEHDLGVGVMPFSRLSVYTVTFYAAGFSLALALVTVRVVYDRAFWAHVHGGLRRSWRFWSFYVGKTAIAAMLVTLAGVEMRFGITMTPTGARDPLVLMLAMWPLLLAFGGALLWSWIDQRLRCRRCLRRLDLPVHMGVLGASLFDPTGVESVCPVGHGALYEPDTEMSDAAWITLDEFFSAQDR